MGFTALVFASLPGFFGSLIIPHTWIGLLGFLPIAIGINHLLNRESEEEAVQAVSIDFNSRAESLRHKKSLLATLRDPQTYRVSAVTIRPIRKLVSQYLQGFETSPCRFCFNEEIRV